MLKKHTKKTNKKHVDPIRHHLKETSRIAPAMPTSSGVGLPRQHITDHR